VASCEPARKAQQGLGRCEVCESTEAKNRPHALGERRVNGGEPLATLDAAAAPARERSESALLAARHPCGAFARSDAPALLSAAGDCFALSVLTLHGPARLRPRRHSAAISLLPTAPKPAHRVRSSSMWRAGAEKAALAAGSESPRTLQPLCPARSGPMRKQDDFLRAARAHAS